MTLAETATAGPVDRDPIYDLYGLPVQSEAVFVGAVSVLAVSHHQPTAKYKPYVHGVSGSAEYGDGSE